MIWIVVVIAGALLFAPPRVRKAGLAIVGVACLAFLAVVLVNRRPASPLPTVAPVGARPSVDAAPPSRQFDFDRYRQERKDREDPDAKSRIPLSAVHFDQVQSVPGIDSGTIRTIRARLYNESAQYALTDYSYYLEIQDCLPVQADEKRAVQCTTVFDQRGWVSATVPANQARDVVIDISKDPKSGAPPFKLLGTPRIELSLTTIRAYVTAQPG